MADAGADPDIANVASERAILAQRAIGLVRAEFEPRTCQAAWRVVVDQQRPRDVAEELVSRSNRDRIASVERGEKLHSVK